MTRLHNLMRTLILTVLAAALPSAAWAQFGGGIGTKYSPYIISTTDHMTELANNVNGGERYFGKYFRLDADLDYTGKTYTVIAANSNSNSNPYFCGNFNGNGHTISGVQLDKTTNSTVSVQVGLFGRTSYNVIENLTLSNSTI